MVIIQDEACMSVCAYDDKSSKKNGMLVVRKF